MAFFDFSSSSYKIRSIKDVRYNYDYPNDLELRPGAPQHDFIVREVMNRAKASHDIMSARYPHWRATDELLTGYIRTDKSEREVKSQDPRKPVSIVIPQTYATLEILLTYMTASLLESPMIRFEGIGPEDLIGAILLEKLLEHQLFYTKAMLELHTVFRCGFVYGLGPVAVRWREDRQLSTTYEEVPSYVDMLLGRPPKKVKKVEERVSFEGNQLMAIDPYDYLPDPYVASHKIQEGEFLGWIRSTNLSSLLKEESSEMGVFNVKYLRHFGNCISGFKRGKESGRTYKTGMSEDRQSTDTLRAVDVVCMYIDIIPKEWKLGDNEYPETWYFEVAGDAVVISARPLGLNHGKKPVCTFTPDFDGFSVSPVSRMEILGGMQTTLNYLFNSHITNVRKAVNDMLIVDPSMVNMNDVYDPDKAGKVIRLHRAAWGRGLDQAIKQLHISDITQANVRDAGIVMELMKNIGGSVDSIAGVTRNTSDRVTAEEVRGERQSGLSRLERLAKICGVQVLQDIGYMAASHIQQFMSTETFVKVSGTWEDVLKQEYGVDAERVMVSPMDINVFYDVVPRDGSISGGNFADVWVQLLPQLLGHPELLSRFDSVRIVKHILRSLGAKDVEYFNRKHIDTQVAPDEEVQEGVATGQLAPIGG